MTLLNRVSAFFLAALAIALAGYSAAVLADQVAEFRQIVESLLFLARAKEDAVAPDPQSIELSTWLLDYVRRWDQHPRRRDLALEMDGDSRVIVSPHLFAQLLDNLIGNAFKYSEPNTPVTLRAACDASQIVLSVEDRGIGIAPTDRAAIFEPFFRSAEARRTGVAGTGLGLAVAFRIAAALGGALRCDSTPHQGSRFSFDLPLAAL